MFDPISGYLDPAKLTHKIDHHTNILILPCVMKYSMENLLIFILHIQQVIEFTKLLYFLKKKLDFQ